MSNAVQDLLRWMRQLCGAVDCKTEPREALCSSRGTSRHQEGHRRAFISSGTRHVGNLCVYFRIAWIAHWIAFPRHSTENQTSSQKILLVTCPHKHFFLSPINWSVGYALKLGILVCRYLLLRCTLPQANSEVVS